MSGMRRMTHVRRFAESVEEVPPSGRDGMSFEQAKRWITDNYDEERVIGMLDEQMHEYVDKEQMEAEEYDSEYDYYVDYGRGEAEADVTRDIVGSLAAAGSLAFDPMAEDTDMYAFIRDKFPCLDY